jgi:FimV-like protein
MRVFFTLALLFSSILFTQIVTALQFGKVEVYSPLHKKLNARIYFKPNADESIADYQFSLAKPEIFKQQNIPFSTTTHDLKFSVISNKATSSYLSVTTNSKLITQSKLTFLLTAYSAKTAKAHTYKVKLTIHPAPLYMNKPKAYFNMGSEHKTLTYGPTTTQDTLMQISIDMRPNKKITLNQMMLAIVKLNPNAFYADNINGLQAGRTLLMPSTKVIASIAPKKAEREVIKQNNLWEDILKSKTAFKQNYSKQLTEEQQHQTEQKNITEKSKTKSPQQEVEPAKYTDALNSDEIMPADLITNTFSIGYENASVNDTTTLSGSIAHQVKSSRLNYINITDHVFSPIGNYFYAEGKLGLSYNVGGSYQQQAWINNTEIINNSGHASSPINYQTELGLGIPLFGGNHFYSSGFQSIAVAGGFYNAERILSNVFFNHENDKDTRINNLKGNLDWYGAYIGNESKLRFKKIDIDVTAKYYLGKFYVEGDDFLGADTVKQSGKANGVQLQMLFIYKFKNRWQLVLGYNYQKFKANGNGKTEISAGDIETSNATVDELFWHSSIYSIGIRHRF